MCKSPLFSLPLTALLILSMSASVEARDTKQMYSIESAMQDPDAQPLLDGDIKFFFGEGNHPKISENLGNWQSNKKANGFARSDSTACKRAFLSAMISLQNRARLEGGDAVINITSYYKKNHISSEKEYECGSGATMSGVTLRGDVAILK